MLYEHAFQNPEGTPRLLAEIERLAERIGPVRLMEICGTHTMAIAKGGLRSLLPASVRLISGPGCPVCVTSAGDIDGILRLSSRHGLLLASYGDLLRVPGSSRGDTLLRRKALGAKIFTVYSPVEAVELAVSNPDKEVVFLGVGFETTAPGTAACLMEARERKVKNFSVLSLLKKTEPALRALIAAPDFAVNGMICPGHVAVVTGAQAFTFLPREYGLPAVISGFEPGDILFSVYRLLQMLEAGKPALENEYTRLVRTEGNHAAMEAVNRVFLPCEAVWRGIGYIPESGYAIREEFSFWDASVRYDFLPEPWAEPSGCRCGDVIRGRISPRECSLFGTSCTPQDPVGPCMVSGEGACAAYYRYQD